MFLVIHNIYSCIILNCTHNVLSDSWFITGICCTSVSLISFFLKLRSSDCWKIIKSHRITSHTPPAAPAWWPWWTPWRCRAQCWASSSTKMRWRSNEERREGNKWWRLLDEFEYIALSISPWQTFLFSYFQRFLTHRQEHAASPWPSPCWWECSGSGRTARARSTTRIKTWRRLSQRFARRGSQWCFSKRRLRVAENSELWFIFSSTLSDYSTLSRSITSRR